MGTHPGQPCLEARRRLRRLVRGQQRHHCVLSSSLRVPPTARPLRPCTEPPWRKEKVLSLWPTLKGSPVALRAATQPRRWMLARSEVSLEIRQLWDAVRAEVRARRRSMGGWHQTPAFGLLALKPSLGRGAPGGGATACGQATRLQDRCETIVVSSCAVQRNRKVFASAPRTRASPLCTPSDSPADSAYYAVCVRSHEVGRGLRSAPRWRNDTGVLPRSCITLACHDLIPSV